MVAGEARYGPTIGRSSITTVATGTRFMNTPMSRVFAGRDGPRDVSFLSPDELRGRVHVGMRFEVREGQRVVGRGVVTKVLAL